MAKDADFAMICSDVVYPSGGIDDYGRTFHHPYRNLELPVYAVPGNHDWYDGLHGFMHYFCKVEDAGYRPVFGRGEEPPQGPVATRCRMAQVGRQQPHVPMLIISVWSRGSTTRWQLLQWVYGLSGARATPYPSVQGICTVILVLFLAACGRADDL